MGLISRVSSRTYRKKIGFQKMDITKEQLYNRLRESGQISVIQNVLQEKLMSSVWPKIIEQKCDQYIDKVGVQKVTLDGLTNEVLPAARASVPEEIKQELMNVCKSYLENNPL